MAAPPEPKVILKSEDNQQFELPKNVACVSTLVSTLVTTDGESLESLKL